MTTRTKTGNSAGPTSRSARSWKDYKRAYEDCLAATSTEIAPWYVVPADDKENARLIVSQIILDTLDDLKMSYPKPDKAHRKELQSIRKLARKITRVPDHMSVPALTPHPDAPAVLAIFATLLTYLGIALGHVPGLKLNRVGIALLGAIAIMIFAGMSTTNGGWFHQLADHSAVVWIFCHFGATAAVGLF